MTTHTWHPPINRGHDFLRRAISASTRLNALQHVVLPTVALPHNMTSSLKAVGGDSIIGRCVEEPRNAVTTGIVEVQSHSRQLTSSLVYKSLCVTMPWRTPDGRIVTRQLGRPRTSRIGSVTTRALEGAFHADRSLCRLVAGHQRAVGVERMHGRMNGPPALDEMPVSMAFAVVKMRAAGRLMSKYKKANR